MSLRTTVELDKIGTLIEGRLEDPTLVLGPRAVEQAGRRALSVRAFLPDTRQAWVVDPLQAVQHPMRRIHPAGLYEAICDMPTQTNHKYLLRSVDQNGKQSTAHDP